MQGLCQRMREMSNLNIEDLIGEDIPTDQKALEEIRAKALSSKMFVDRIITRDSKHTGMIITFERLPEYVYCPVEKGFSPTDEWDWPPEKVIMRNRIFTEAEAAQRPDLALTKVFDPRKLIAPAVHAILKRHENEHYKVLTTGIPIIDSEGEKITAVEGKKFGMLALVLSIVFLTVLFRNFTGVVAPFLVILFTLILLYGLMGWFAIPITLISMIIAPLTLVISVSYSIHVINHFRQHFRHTGSRKEAVRYAFEHATWPCFITAATTAMGFVSFLVVPMRPIREVGLACAVGVFITYLLVMLIVPAFFSFGKDKSPKSAARSEDAEKCSPSRLMGKWANLVINNSLLIGLVAFIILAGAIFFAFRMPVDTDSLEMMGDKIEYVRNTRTITERLGGLYSYEVLIEFPEDGMAKDPDVLHTMDAIARKVNTWKSTTMSTSLNNVLKELNWVMHNKDEAYYVIPESRDLIAQYLLLYEMSGGEGTEDWVDYDYRFLRLSVQVDKAASGLEDELNTLQRFAENKFPEGTKVTMVGDVPILIKMLNRLTEGQIKSIGAAFLVISVMMMLILRSFRVGLMSMIPNVFPVVIAMGLMGLLDVSLDMMTVMIAPMIIGIAVDDTVHYFVHFKQEFNKCGGYADANRETFQKIGYAILFTSVVLVVGFSIFGLSNVRSMVHMGIVSGAGILSALLADLFITPVLFVRLKPFGKR